MTPSVSMVICTKDRAAMLARCLRAVQEIEAEEPFEFVLVDNGSSDATADVFRDFARDVPFAATYVHEGRAGVGWGMRAGLAACKGEIVLCSDDDCYPERDIVAVARSVFEDPAVGVAQGRILLFDEADAHETAIEAVEPRVYRPGTCVQVGDFMGGNLAFRKEALTQCGGFDPLFGPGSVIGSGADIDAAGRVVLAGWTGVFAPELVVYHNGRSAQDLPAMRRRYDLGRGAFLMKQWLMAPWRLKPWVGAVFVRDMIRAQGPDKALGVLSGAARYLRHRRDGVTGGPRARPSAGRKRIA